MADKKVPTKRVLALAVRGGGVTFLPYKCLTLFDRMPVCLATKFLLGYNDSSSPKLLRE